MEKSEWDNLMKQGIIVVNKNPDEQGKIKRTSFLVWLKTETAYFMRNIFRPWRIFTYIHQMNKEELDKLVQQGTILVNNGPNEIGEKKVFYINVGETSSEEIALSIKNMNKSIGKSKYDSSNITEDYFLPEKKEPKTLADLSAKMDAIDGRIDALEKKTDSIIRYSDYLSKCIQGVKDELNTLKNEPKRGTEETHDQDN